MLSVCLYVPFFTRAQGIIEFVVRVRDGEAALFEVHFQATCGDPRSTSDLRVPVNGLAFAKPGVYVIEALADGVVFARRWALA
jgi:hypothetical protein